MLYDQLSTFVERKICCFSPNKKEILGDIEGLLCLFSKAQQQRRCRDKALRELIFKRRTGQITFCKTLSFEKVLFSLRLLKSADVCQG